MKQNTSKVVKKTNRRPHVKWGALIIGIMSLLTEVALFALNIYANTGKLAEVTDNLGIALLAAYGWLFGGFFLVVLGIEYIREDFLPSYKEYKAWKER